MVNYEDLFSSSKVSGGLMIALIIALTVILELLKLVDVLANATDIWLFAVALPVLSVGFALLTRSSTTKKTTAEQTSPSIYQAGTTQAVSRLEGVEPPPLPQKMRTLADTFKPIMIGTSNLAIKNIALDLLSSKGVDEPLGKGVEGWRTYFGDYGGEASLSFNRVTNNLTKFTQEPQNQGNLQDLVIDFKDWLSMHYTLVDRFYRMLEDIGAKNMTKTIEDRFKLFRGKYDLFISKLLDIVDDLEKHGALLRGTVYLGLIEELEQRHGFVFPSRYS